MIARLAFDTETELIESGNSTPRLACLSLARPDQEPELFSRHIGVSILRAHLKDPGKPLIIGFHIVYDFGILCAEDEALIPLVFEAYREGRVRDVMLREILIQIREGRSGGNPHLDEVAEKYLGHSLDKGADSWRYWYGDLMDVPLEQWPSEARYYALGDASATLRTFDAQQQLGGVDHERLLVSPDEILQTRAAWVLHLMRCWGFRTDGSAVAKLKAELEIECAAAFRRLMQVGLYKPKSTRKALKDLRGDALLAWFDGEQDPEKRELSKDMAALKSRIVTALTGKGLEVPYTPASKTHPDGQIVTDKNVLLMTDDPDLEALAEIGPKQKLLSTFIPLVEKGVKSPVTPRWNPLVRTGRTSCGAGSEDDPGNWQNPARKGGIRECVIPRPGKIFGGVDYGQLELCTLSQVLLRWVGWSRMAEAIQAGKDLHLAFACSDPTMLGGVPYDVALARLRAEDPEVEFHRQFAKAANFGFPGGLGPDTFIGYAKGYGIKDLTRDRAERIKSAWLAQWPEMKIYFSMIADLVERGQPITQLSGRVRYTDSFCAAANTMFQGHAADGAKDAGWQIAWKCYCDPKSALFGARLILFLHDEWIIEVDEDRAPEATDEMCRIMIKVMQRWCPDIPIKAEPRLMRRWYKKAKEKRDVNGRLIPWEPKK